MPDMGKYPIGSDKPDDFDPKFLITLQLEYLFTPKGYKFRYRSKKVDATSNNLAEFLVPVFSEGDWKDVIKRVNKDGSYVAELNIDMEYGDAVVVVETIDHDVATTLFWSEDTRKPAVMTREKREDLYFELLYWDGTTWVPQPVPNCRRITFKAKLNTDLNDTKHNFSYNVRLKNDAGLMVPFEIDPDIRNPTA